MFWHYKPAHKHMRRQKVWEGPFHKRRSYCLRVGNKYVLSGRAVEDSKYCNVREELLIRRQKPILPRQKSWSSYFRSKILMKRIFIRRSK